MMDSRDFIVFGSPLIEEDEIREVEDTLRSGWLGTGPKVSRFEEMFSNYKDNRFAIALNSCTAALHLSLLTLGLKQGDEVITTPMTFCATVNAIIHSGATPVLADCERDSMNIDPVAIERQITKKTRAILPVHFAGRPCKMDEIMDIAAKYRLKVVEDCAHAIESEYKGKKTGIFGDLGCFSFYITKNIVTGEGGMVLTNNEEYANQIKIFGLHGMTKDAWNRFGDDGYRHYDVIYPGFKYNMMDIQAALGIHQIRRIEKYWKKRKRIWERYNKAFKELPVSLPMPPESNTKHAYHLYTILINEKAGISRDEFILKLTQKKIGIGVHYRSIPMHPYYRDNFNMRLKDYPNADYIGNHTVSLPLSPKLSDDDVSYVIETVVDLLSK